eukprot:6989254-Pyramimonas_sp.AAC.1
MAPSCRPRRRPSSRAPWSPPLSRTASATSSALTGRKLTTRGASAALDAGAPWHFPEVLPVPNQYVPERAPRRG